MGPVRAAKVWRLGLAALALACGCVTVHPIETEVTVPLKGAVGMMLKASYSGFMNTVRGPWKLRSLKAGPDGLDVVYERDGDTKPGHFLYRQMEVIYAEVYTMHHYSLVLGPEKDLAQRRVVYVWPTEEKDDVMLFARGLRSLKDADAGEIESAYGRVGQVSDRDEP